MWLLVGRLAKHILWWEGHKVSIWKHRCQLTLEMISISCMRDFFRNISLRCSFLRMLWESSRQTVVQPGWKSRKRCVPLAMRLNAMSKIQRILVCCKTEEEWSLSGGWRTAGFLIRSLRRKLRRLRLMTFSVIYQPCSQEKNRINTVQKTSAII